jgi:hypothetical protein
MGKKKIMKKKMGNYNLYIKHSELIDSYNLFNLLYKLLFIIGTISVLTATICFIIVLNIKIPTVFNLKK